MVVNVMPVIEHVFSADSNDGGLKSGWADSRHCKMSWIMRSKKG